MIDVVQTFASHEVLLTGANGFLGKVILASMLDRLPHIKHVHLLIRGRADNKAGARFNEEILTSPALEGIAGRRGPEYLREKITVHAGDVGEPDCGLGADALNRLAGRSLAIINCAGLVEFFPPITDSFRSNVHGVRHIAHLARRLGARLAHISTCFVCGEGEGLIEETPPVAGFYPKRKGPDDASFNPEKEIGHCLSQVSHLYRAEGASEDEGTRPRLSKDLTRRLVDLGRQRAALWGWVNTYTYAKSLGEQLLAAETGLDYAIIRPAIVESALRFPFPGWIEGGRTSAPLVLMARGGMAHWPVKRNAPLEVVPVDLVASAVLVITALLLNGRHERVYQLGTADMNPIRLGELVEMLANGARFVSPEKLRRKRVRLQKNLGRAQSLVAGVRKMVENAGLPGRRSLADLSLNLRTRSLQASLREQTLDQYLPFIFDNHYIFESENVRAAYEQISAHDRRLLPWDPESVVWEDYWRNNQIQGIERWIQPEAVKDWALRI